MGICFGNHAFKYPAWMLCYLVNPKDLPTAVWYPLFLAMMIGSGALGAYLAHGFIARGQKRSALWLAAGMLLLWLALFGLTLQRYLVIGSFGEWATGRALPLAAQPAVIHDFNVVTALTAIPLLALLGAILWRNCRGAPAEA
jgi:Na+/phosphate symporter